MRHGYSRLLTMWGEWNGVYNTLIHAKCILATALHGCYLVDDRNRATWPQNFTLTMTACKRLIYYG